MGRLPAYREIRLKAISSGPSQISRFRISAKVTKLYYYGKVEIELLQGLYNLADGSVTTKEIGTGPINMIDVMQNWELVPPEKLVEKPVGFEFHVADAWLFDEIVKNLRVDEIRAVSEMDLRT